MSRLTARSGDANGTLKRLATAQGIYYVATGLWPLVSMRTFEKVTGPKKDDWLVKTVGVLVTAVGGTLLAAAAKDEEMGPEVPILAAGSAVGLAGIDTWYAGKGRISPIYLADALAEVGLAAAWAKAWRAERS